MISTGPNATAAQGTKADSALQPAGNGSSLTGLTASQVGLGNVTNTSDANKPVSTAQQTALNLKADATTVGAKMVADTGWTGNSDAGDKTAIIPTSATLAAMQAALNIVSAGFGDAFVAMGAKVKALEAALVANKLPNA